MRLRSMAVGVAAVLAFGSMSAGIAHADPAPATTLYVDNNNRNCTDTGSGAAAAPFCTIQAAADAVEPGQTVVVSPNAAQLDPSTYGQYDENVKVTNSGTASEPITFTTGDPVAQSDWGDPADPAVTIQPVGGQLSAGFTLAGVQHVVVRGFAIAQTTDAGIIVTDSSDITLDDNLIGPGLGTTVPQTGINVTGSSSDVTVSRNAIQAADNAVSLGSGVSGVTVTTNQFQQSAGEQVSVSGATGTAITGNSWDAAACQTVIAVSGASGTTIENNTIDGDCTGVSAPVPAEISIAADSTSGTTLDYNMPYRADSSAPYSWGGTTYATAAALTAATGQGSHDINASSIETDASAGVPITNAAIDDANANAPGELSTDLAGFPRVDDPVVANTGTGPGIGTGYYDRGAYEAQDPLAFDPEFLNTQQAPTGATVTATIRITNDSWSSELTETVDFGDGSAPVTAVSGVVTHVYSTAGTYPVTLKVGDAVGTTRSWTNQVTIVAPQPLVPHITATTLDALSVDVDFSGTTSGYSITGGTFDPGDGTAPEPIGPGGTGIFHTYSKPGTYTIKVTFTDAGGNSASTSAVFTTAGSDYVPYGPARLLDTRKGTGTGGKLAKLAAGGVVKLQIGGNGAIPAGVTAVTLNLTATDTTGSGFVTAYADGTSVPAVSNVNYTAGQTVSNASIVPVGSDGYVDLRNGGGAAGTIDLIADVTGYFTQGSGTADGYTALSPARLLDTRKGTGTGTVAKVPAGGTVALTINGADGGQLPSGVAAVALNVTATNTVGTGFITAYPDGSAVPTASNVNYVAGQTVANAVIVPVGSDGKVDLRNGGAAAGSVDLIADVTGYFSASGASAYVPITQTRILDMRKTSPVAAGGTAVVDPNAFLPGGSEADPHDPATGFAVNTTVTEPTGTGFITAYPDGSAVPGVSTLDYTPNLTVANLALVTPGSETDQQVDFRNGGTSAGTVELIVDLFGYFSSE